MSLRDLIAQRMVVAPGVYDGFSAKVADRSTFEALYMSGYFVAGSRYGVPDAGLIGLHEMLDALSMIVRCSSKPVIADADTGYGGLLNVQHTVLSYEAAGAAALHIEDQAIPKKCGHTQGKVVVPTQDMVQKIHVAAEARRTDDFVIIARTDSLASEGFDSAMKRSEAYLRAGADLVFMDAIQTYDQMRAFADAFPRRCMINIVPFRHFVTPEITTRELDAMGYALAIFPGSLGIPAMGAMRNALHRLAAGEPSDHDALDISPHELIGFDQVWADEARWAQTLGASKEG